MRVQVEKLWEQSIGGKWAVQVYYLDEDDNRPVGSGLIWCQDYHHAQAVKALPQFCHDAVARHGMGYFWSDALYDALVAALDAPTKDSNPTLSDKDHD